MKALILTSLLVAFTSITTNSRAQNVYKCSANTYSQIPCPDGVKLPVTQAPGNVERRRADEATARDARTADGMEKARLKQEQLDLKANTPDPAKVTRTVSEKPRKLVKSKDFVAEAPGTKKVPVKKSKSTAN